MTTERLYYNDSYTLAFEADVLEATTYARHPALILDRTYFYPEGGGQPPDQGVLNGVPVIDVQTRESDRAVLHVLKGELTTRKVAGTIDAARRNDHMQHHSGQHILSQALSQAAHAETVSVHMSPDSMTIDVDKPDLSLDDLVAAEELANQVTFENRLVRTWFPGADELAVLRLRKLPDVAGKVRVVDIGGFDITACGGTHVARSAEIGLVKIVRAERRGNTTRLEFRCGWRALRDYRDKNAIMNQLAAELTVGYWEVGNSVTRLQAENKILRADLKAARDTLVEAEGASLLASARPTARGQLITVVFDGRDANELKLLVSKLTAQTGIIALIGNAGEKSGLLFGRSADLALDMVSLLKMALKRIGSQRGGGQPSFAQGGGVPASVAELEAAIAEAAQSLDD
ncbi:MAG TPA: DHHA1 domain-containing protein [Aggregatilineaceae bacterium]|nr:DHHA1 domain-containing protein [Aggregatilineaceae bacterium]